MKTVGILLREKENEMIINKEIIEYLSNYDVNIIGIIIDYNVEFNKIINIVKICDGVILPGGTNQSNIDIRLARYLYDIDKPTLGICLGMQNMAVANNGTIEKLGNNFHDSDLTYVHKINIKKGTKLYGILETNKMMVNSRHSYHVTYTNLDISAYSEDYVIEAVEAKNKKFYIGVQWHPESIQTNINSKLLIDEFINKL